MNIIFDNIIFALQKSGGISTVWKELLVRCLKKKQNIKTTCINYSNQNINSDINFNLSDFIINKKLQFSWSRYLPIYLNNNTTFIFHSSYYRICKNPHAINITTIHDFTYEYFNHGLKKWIHSWQKKYAILHSDYIICISENTKKDLLKFIPEIDSRKIFVVYNGVSEDYHRLKLQANINHIIPYEPLKYVLFIGSRAKYKNFELTVKAISQTNLNLVVVGPELNNREKHFIKKNFQEISKVYCVGHINNKTLNILYNNAFALIYPSLYEGFGIPVLEAQRAGCPAIACNNSSIPEIIGDKSLLMKEASIKELHRCLTILLNPNQRERIIKLGLDNSKRFSWDKMYNDILTIYQKAWNSKTLQ